MNWGKYWNMDRVARKWLSVPENLNPRKRAVSIFGLVDTAKRLNIIGVLIDKQVLHYYNILPNFINFKDIVLVFTLIFKPFTNHWH